MTADRLVPLEKKQPCIDVFRLVSGVTGQIMPPAGLNPGLKRPRLDYTWIYYGLGQFITRGILWPRPIQASQIIPHDKKS